MDLVDHLILLCHICTLGAGVVVALEGAIVGPDPRLFLLGVVLTVSGLDGLLAYTEMET